MRDGLPLCVQFTVANLTISTWKEIEIAPKKRPTLNKESTAPVSKEEKGQMCWWCIISRIKLGKNSPLVRDVNNDSSRIQCNIFNVHPPPPSLFSNLICELRKTFVTAPQVKVIATRWKFSAQLQKLQCPHPLCFAVRGEGRNDNTAIVQLNKVTNAVAWVCGKC